jgi:hypothetical protein
MEYVYNPYSQHILCSQYLRGISLNPFYISDLLGTDAESNPFQVRLLAMLNEYNHLRQEKEEEKRRMRVRTTKSYNCVFFGEQPYPS